MSVFNIILLYGDCLPSSCQPTSAVHTGSGSSNGSNGASHDTSSRGGSPWETFHFSGGLKEYVQYNNRDNATLHEPICIGRTVRAYASHVHVAKADPHHFGLPYVCMKAGMA